MPEPLVIGRAATPVALCQAGFVGEEKATSYIPSQFQGRGFECIEGARRVCHLGGVLVLERSAQG